MNDYIVDLVLLLIFALITFLYSKKGFVKTVLDSVSWILAIVGAKILSEPAQDFITENTSLLNNIEIPMAKIAVFVLLFFVVFILLKWIIAVIDKIFKLPVLKQVNVLLGIAVGMICAAAAVIIICMLLRISSDVVYNSEYVSAIEHSRIVKFIADNGKILNKLDAIG